MSEYNILFPDLLYVIPILAEWVYLKRRSLETVLLTWKYKMSSIKISEILVCILKYCMTLPQWKQKSPINQNYRHFKAYQSSVLRHLCLSCLLTCYIRPIYYFSKITSYIMQLPKKPNINLRDKSSLQISKKEQWFSKAWMHEPYSDSLRYMSGWGVITQAEWICSRCTLSNHSPAAIPTNREGDKAADGRRYPYS